VPPADRRQQTFALLIEQAENLALERLVAKRLAGEVGLVEKRGCGHRRVRRGNGSWRSRAARRRDPHPAR
jgi:hypothetical protein